MSSVVGGCVGVWVVVVCPGCAEEYVKDTRAGDGDGPRVLIDMD